MAFCGCGGGGGAVDDDATEAGIDGGMESSADWLTEAGRAAFRPWLTTMFPAEESEDALLLRKAHAHMGLPTFR